MGETKNIHVNAVTFYREKWGDNYFSIFGKNFKALFSEKLDVRDFVEVFL